MSRKPRAVQLEALKRARGKRGFGIIMEQGLGKTGTALLEATELYAEEGVDCMVTLCPNSFKGGWEQEAFTWGFPIESYIYESSSDLRIRRNRPGFQNLVVNFEAIRSEATRESIRRFIQGRRYYIVADESVQLAAYNSAQTKGAIDLSKGADWRRILSGRWIRNAPDDTWAQLRFIGAIDGFMYYPFRHTFCTLGGFKGKLSIGSKNEERFAELVNPYIFEALKKDWGLDIPKTYSIKEYKLTPDMQRHFDDMYHDFMIQVEEETVAIDVAVAKYEKLSQIQAGYIIREDGTSLELVSPAENPRLKVLRDFVANEVRGKVAIPYTHKYVGNLLAKAYPNAAHLRGGMTPREIVLQKEMFNNDASCKEILLQTRSSKYGHTLLGDQSVESNVCATMAFFENTYSMDDRAQIEDRIHRDGQKASSVGYTDFSGTLVDRNMVTALQRRYSMYEALMATVRGQNFGIDAP